MNIQDRVYYYGSSNINKILVKVRPVSFFNFPMMSLCYGFICCMCAGVYSRVSVCVWMYLTRSSS